MEQEYLLKKWLNNEELSAEERQAFEALEDFELHQAILDNSKYFKAEHFSEIPSFQSMEDRLPSTTKVKKLDWIRPLMRIASIAVIAFGIYFFFFSTNISEIQTLAGEKKIIDLPDTSQVVLNAMSEISFNELNWDTKRQLELKGEAFFKVAKGKQFDVITNQGTISVLGTQFNVKERAHYFEVICYEGLVQVKTEDTIKNLSVGETLRLYDGLLSFSKTTNQAPQWTHKRSTFKSVPFYQVIKELERQYKVTVEYTGEKKSQLFTGGFVHDSLENALHSISEPLELTYNIVSPHQVILSKGEKD